MEGAAPFIWGVIIYNFSLPVIIPLIFFIRSWRFVRLKIVYLLLTVVLCYLSGVIFVFSLHIFESKLERFALPFDPYSVGFFVHHGVVPFLYALVSWNVLRFFKNSSHASLEPSTR